MKNWEVKKMLGAQSLELKAEDVIKLLLKNRGLTKKKEVNEYLNPPHPFSLKAKDVGINFRDLAHALKRIQKAIDTKESIVVYADYDADGVTAGAVLWETLHAVGAKVMPYIPHRVEEGYGLSQKGIDTVREQYKPTLIITVDHGITGKEKVEYARKLGMDVIVTDHHVKPDKLPDCTIIHTTELSGSGVAWFLSKKILKANAKIVRETSGDELLALAAMGTIADMVPLVGVNRAIAKYGLKAINKTDRIGLLALLEESGLTKGNIRTYEISHILGPRLNAMGRLVHAMDALRLLCTKQTDKALLLARQLGLTNRERQQLTTETVVHALQGIIKTNGEKITKKLLFISHESYNQGVIGLVAGKLVEQYYLPSIVVARGEIYSKASARSIKGFNIVEAIRSCSDILVDVGGHPMAAGFTVETRNLTVLQERLEKLAEKEITEKFLTRTLSIDIEIPLEAVSVDLWQKLRDFEPFGFGNPEPTFVTRGVQVIDARLVGTEGKHLKFKVKPALYDSQFIVLDAIAFGMGQLYGQLRPDSPVDIAFTIDLDSWSGSSKLQLKIKDIH